VQLEILGLVSDELHAVESLFRENLASPTRIIDELGGFIREGGGKRIRPTVHLLCARLCDYRGPHAVLLGTVLEFIHGATLIHDDILDEARTRRGRPSLNARWGNNVSVLFGDYMFAKAMQLALRAESLRVMDKLAAVTLRMTEGEMLQTRYVGRTDVTVGDYVDLVLKKTASLFGCCCELAAILGAGGPERERALADYGTNLGMAFQLVDDLLDLIGDPRQLGKPAGNDLREGKATLAVIDLLGSGAPLGRQLVQRIMESGAEGGEALDHLRRLLCEHGSLERSRAMARDYADRAVAALEPFPAGPARAALEALPHLLLQRDR
jgi:octaprenyl-diphosphate synthase